MVALNAAYAPEETDERPENRVGGFFFLAAERAESDRPASPDRIGEKRGHGYDGASGVTVYGFRYYDPETGRWLSRDPLGEFSALNIYAFISNDPLNDFDLIGLTSYKGGSGANYRPDPFGHGSNADGSPRDPHIDRIEKGGQKSRYNPDGSPRKGAGNVPRKDQQAMGRAVSKLASILSRFVTLPVMLYVEPPEIEYPEPKDSVSPACSEVKPCEWKCKCPSGFINFGGQKIYKQKEAPSPDWLCDDAEFIL